MEAGGTWAVRVAIAVLVTAASAHDLRTRRIPNPLLISGCAAGILLNTAINGWHGAAYSIAGLAVGLLLMLPGYLLRFTGGGDVKLLAAVGSLLGPQAIAYAFVFAVIAGAVVAIVQGVYAWAIQGASSPAARYGVMLTSLFALGRLTYIRPDEAEALGRRFPLAPAIAVGSITASLLLA